LVSIAAAAARLPAFISALRAIDMPFSRRSCQQYRLMRDFGIKHDPEKACPGLDPGRKPVC
jgi:hypothetical protein